MGHSDLIVHVADSLRECIEGHITRVRPEHVIVDDRHGAKVWDILEPGGPGRFTWGRNLWHSTTVDMMPREDMRRCFRGGVRVLLVSTSLRSAGEMRELRSRLEAGDVDAYLVSILGNEGEGEQARHHRRPAQIDESRGESWDKWRGETLWSHRRGQPSASEIAWLLSVLTPATATPLDIDHMEMQAEVDADFSADTALQSMAGWGWGFAIRDRDQRLIGLTLDRPQFFDAAGAASGWTKKGFKVDWSGPCKVRLYLGQPTKPNTCVFVTYPDIKAPSELWLTFLREALGERVTGFLDCSGEGGRALTRAYRVICMNLSIKLLEDLVSSGVAHCLGLKLELGVQGAGKLRSVCGPQLGDRLIAATRAALAVGVARAGVATTAGRGLAPTCASQPPPLLLRNEGGTGLYDLTACRKALHEVIPPSPKEDPAVTMPTVSYRDIFESLKAYAEPIVSQALDMELDTTAVSPYVGCESSTARDGVEVVNMRRGYYRGEYPGTGGDADPAGL